MFVFFGLVAVVGTTYVQTETWEWPALFAAVGVGSLACAILVVNNLRDIPSDTVAGKRTLAVKLGPDRTRALYVLLVLAAAAAVVAVAVATTWWALLGLGFLVVAAARGPDGHRWRDRTDARPGPPADRAGRARLGGPRVGRRCSRPRRSLTHMSRSSSSWPWSWQPWSSGGCGARCSPSCSASPSHASTGSSTAAGD